MKDLKNEASRWLREAKHDLDFSRVALSTGFYSKACFNSEQAAEKAVKAVLYARGERLVIGHSVTELFKRLDLDERTARQVMGITHKLDQYYIPTRYPNAFASGPAFEHYGKAQAEEAIEMASGLVDLCEQLVASAGAGEPA